MDVEKAIDSLISEQINKIVEGDLDLSPLKLVSAERTSLLRRIASDCLMVGRRMSETLLASKDEKNNLDRAGGVAYCKVMAEQQAALFEALANYYAKLADFSTSDPQHDLWAAEEAAEEIERLIDL